MYEKIITPGWTVAIDILDDTSAEAAPEELTTYDSRIKYTLDCFRKNINGGPADFMWSITSSEPTNFEYDSDKRGDLPIIEEKKQIECSTTSRMRRPKDGFKGTIKRPQHDIITGTILHVHSHYLLNVLRATIQYTTDLDDYNNGVFNYPYMDLYRHREEIEAYKKSDDRIRAKHSLEYNEQCDSHIDILLQYLDSLPVMRYAQHRLLWSKPKAMTTFAGVALLLKPCTDVYVHEDGKLNAFVVDRLRGGVRYPIEPGASAKVSTYRVVMWNLHFDGKAIYRRSKTVLIPYFDGEREIASLTAFPAEYRDRVDSFATREKLVERGKKYFSYCKRPTFLEYTGPGLKEGWKTVRLLGSILGAN